MEFSLQTLLILLISFISLFFSFFWLSTLYFEEPFMHKGNKKLKRFPMVSIIVPAYNEEDSIADTLKSLFTLDYPKDKLEIIVVANNCKDRTVEIVRQFKQVRLIETPTPGKAKAQNLGIKHAKGEIVVVADADLIVTKDSLLRLLPYFEDSQIAEVVPAVKVYKPQNFLQNVQRYEYITSAFIKQLLAGWGAMFLAPGAFNAYRKSIIQKVGGFDEHTLTEDLEMATRLLRIGYKVTSNIDAHVSVRAPMTLAAFHTQRLRWNRGFIEVVSKHREVLFNLKFGLFGILLPLSIMVPVLLTTVMAVGIAQLASFLYDFAFLLSFSDLKLMLANLLPKGILYTNTLLLIPAVAVLITGIYIYTKANKHLKERWTNPLAAFTFIVLYPMWLTFYWLLAFVLHITKAKKTWRGSVRW
ncbi:MAG: glycosyltransferase [DPANN group archaeon]|nr:glycosyltransferase [DPANN group archaeon]